LRGLGETNLEGISFRGMEENSTVDNCAVGDTFGLAVGGIPQFRGREISSA